MLLMYFRFACSRDIFRCNQLLYGTGPFWKYSRSLSKELDLLLILNTNAFDLDIGIEKDQKRPELSESIEMCLKNKKKTSQSK